MFLQVKNVWFNRGGLTPLCIDHVLVSDIYFSIPRSNFQLFRHLLTSGLSDRNVQ